MPHPLRQIATAICRLAPALAATLGLSFCLTASAGAVSLVSQPSASTRPGTGVEEIVARGSDNHVYYTSFNGSQWTGWGDLGGIATGRPAVFSWAANHVDVYSRDGDNRLMHKYWTGTAWTGWQPICGASQLASDPTIVSWGPGRVDAFAKGTNGQLIHCYYNGSTWSSWASKGGSLISKPVVTSLMPGRLSVYALGTGGIMSHIYWDNANGAWSAWDRIGNLTYTDAPAVSKWYDGSAQQINIYARRSNSDPALYENWWSNANSWTFDTSMGGNVAGTPTTASMNYGHLDLFARSGVDNTLYNRSCCYPGWTGWVRRGPSVIALGSDPSAIGYPGHMSVYALDTGGSLLHTAWYDGGWHDWNYLGQPGGANPYPTSMEYGGYDRSVNNQTEFVNLYQALTVASDSVADQMLAGLSPTDRQALFTWPATCRRRLAPRLMTTAAAARPARRGIGAGTIRSSVPRQSHEPRLPVSATRRVANKSLPSS